MLRVVLWARACVHTHVRSRVSGPVICEPRACVRVEMPARNCVVYFISISRQAGTELHYIVLFHARTDELTDTHAR